VKFNKTIKYITLHLSFR